MPTVHAKAIKITLVIADPAELAALAVPDQPRYMLTIDVAGRRLSADLNAKSVRKALATVHEHGAEAVAVIVQGRLVAESVVEAGLTVMLKQPKAADADAAARPVAA